MGKPFRPKLSKPLKRWPTSGELVRFLEKIKEGIVPKGFKSPCWDWTDRLDDKGYGQFWFAGKHEWAHRFAFQALKHVKLKPGMEAHHECLNTSCVNPDHLSPLTKIDNTALGNKMRKQ